jgi:hypothetical protein
LNRFLKKNKVGLRGDFMGKKKVLQKNDPRSLKARRSKKRAIPQIALHGSDASDSQKVQLSDSDPWGYSKGYPQISKERLSPGPNRTAREKEELLKKRIKKK